MIEDRWIKRDPGSQPRRTPRYGHGLRYRVRWAAGGRERSRSFATMAEARSFTPPHRGTPRPRRLIIPWTDRQLTAIRSGLPARWQLLADLGAGLGLRQGEVFAVAVENFTDDGAGFRVVAQVKLIRGRPVFAPPKNGRDRAVPVPPGLQQLISAHKAAHPPVRVTLPWEHPGGRARTLTLLFTTVRGHVLNRNDFNRRTWKPALEAAGIDATPASGMHALRHTFASRLQASGADLGTIRDLLGHDSTRTTDKYLHQLGNADQRTRRAVARIQPRRPRPAPALPPGVADFSAYKIRRTSCLADASSSAGYRLRSGHRDSGYQLNDESRRHAALRKVLFILCFHASPEGSEPHAQGSPAFRGHRRNT